MEAPLTAEPPSIDWRGLSAAEPEAVAAASAEVEMFVRALAAYGVIADRDGTLSELEDRQATLRAKIWPETPLEGFGLHSSLGAFLVTKVAVDLVPTGHVALRPEHLDADGLHRALVDQGLKATEATAITGEWPGEPAGFTGDPEGLSLSILAGLAARTLTRNERVAALAQVAASPRDLARLGVAAKLLTAVRAVLPLLPIPSLGPEYDIAVVGLSIGQGERVAALLNRPRDVLQAALTEIAAAMAKLSAGVPYEMGTDVQVVSPMPLSSDLWAEDTDSDAAPTALAGLCRWRDGSVREEDVAAWRAEMLRWRASAGTLGLRLPAPAATVFPRPVPPAAGLVRRSILPHTDDGTDRIELEAPPYQWRGDPIDALAPTVRGALRLVVAAAEGTPPPPGALDKAGDLSWLVRRATALSAMVTGEMQVAIDATDPLPHGSAPERRWVQDRLRRFGGRPADPIEPDEARRWAAVLAGDLAAQLARTITGMVPEERH